MDAADMLELEYVSNVPRGPNGESLACGMFCVPKDRDADRLITNRIPANSLEAKVGASQDCFPHGCCFCELQLSRNEALDCSVMDLPDYYHLCRVSRARALRNQLGPPLAAREVEALGAYSRLVAREGPPDRNHHLDDVYVKLWGGPEKMVPLQATLPMGDRNATDFGQTAHIGLLRSEGAADPGHLVTYRAPVPRGPVWQAVMIDDDVILGRCRRKRGTGSPGEPPAQTALVVQRSLAAYRAAGLEPKPKKTTLHASKVHALGATIDGSRGWVAARAEHLAACFATWGSAVGAKGAKYEKAALGLGLLTHILMMRRDTLCLADRLFIWVHEVSLAPARFRRMPDGVTDEVLVLALLGPLLGTDLRVRSHPELLCTDARGGAFPRGGVCRSPILPAVSKELWRHRVRRGGFPRLDPPSLTLLREHAGWNADWAAELQGAEEEALEDNLVKTRSWVKDLVGALPWQRSSFGFPLPRHEHINLGEHRAMRAGTRLLLKEGIHDCRVLTIVDSNVVLGATAKGRSGSRWIRRLQQAHIAELLYHNVYVGVLPIASQFNPADDPSRGVPVRLPIDDPAEWAESFLQGNVEAIDAHPKLAKPRHEHWLVRPDSRPPPAAGLRHDWHASHADWFADRTRQATPEGPDPTPPQR